MKPNQKNALAVVLGWMLGSAINMGLIKAGHKVYPIPGVDPDDMEAVAAAMPTLDSEFFIFPFLAHALGTLVGAIVAGSIATNNKMKYSLIVGGIFFLGGLAVNYMIGGPVWFAITDILLAYIPMAWIGGKVAESISNNTVN